MRENCSRPLQAGILIRRKLAKPGLLLITVFLVAASAGFAQRNEVPLQIVLDKLALKYRVHFNYIEGQIAGHSLQEPDMKGGLKKILAELETRTALGFSLVSDGYVVIYKKTDPVFFICAILKDAETQEPISDVTVSGPQSETVSTDRNGYFTARLVRDGELQFSHTGYKISRVFFRKQGQDGCRSIVLEREVKSLKGVLVQRFLTRGLQVNTDRSYKLFPKQSGLLPGLTEPDVLLTLQQLPGLVSVDQSVSNISVRSGTHDQNLFLWNGIRLFQVGHFFGMISAFNPNLPHSVTMYKNGTPALLGESVSGTILVESPPDTVGLRQHSSAGINMVNADFNTAFRTSPDTWWQFSGRRSITDFVHSPVYSRYYDRVFQNTKVTNFFADEAVNYSSEENFRFYDLTAQVKHRIDSQSSIAANLIIIGNNLQLIQKSDEDSVAETSNLKQMSAGGNIVYERKWSPRSQSSVSGFISRYKLDAEDFYINSNLVSVQTNQVTDRGLLVTHKQLLSGGIRLRANYQLGWIGIENDDHERTADTTNDERRSLVSQSLAVEAGGAIKNIYFTAGIRNQHFITYGIFRPEPRLNLSYAVSSAVTVNLSGESKSQAAFQQIGRQQDFFGIESRRWRLSDGGEMPVLKSHQASVQAQFQQLGWLLSAEMFAKKVKGITSRSQGFQNQFSQSNAVGDYSVNGVELLIQKIYRAFTGWANFQLTDSKYNFRQLNPRVFPNSYEIPHLLRFGLIYGGDRWKAALGGTWAAGRHFTQTLSRIPVIENNGTLSIQYDQPNNQRLSSNFQVNLSGSATISLSRKSQLRFGMGIQNLFDHSFVINRTYRINNASETIEEIDDYNLARTLNCFLRFLF